jgi:hypothetical protein
MRVALRDGCEKLLVDDPRNCSTKIFEDAGEDFSV